MSQTNKMADEINILEKIIIIRSHNPNSHLTFPSLFLSSTRYNTYKFKNVWETASETIGSLVFHRGGAHGELLSWANGESRGRGKNVLSWRVGHKGEDKNDLNKMATVSTHAIKSQYTDVLRRQLAQVRKQEMHFWKSPFGSVHSSL